jgi:hypothetical protein
VRNVSRGKLAFTINEIRFSIKPSSLTGFGEKRQVLFTKVFFKDGRYYSRWNRSRLTCGFHSKSAGGIAFVNSSSDETGHAIRHRFRQVFAAGNPDFVAIPQRRPPGSSGLVAA